MSRVSVIIPARNAAATISRVLRSLEPDRDVIGEILLVDDQSGDGTAVRAQMTAQELQLPLTLHRVLAGSAGGARNAGLERAVKPLVYFIDADDILLPKGLGKLVAIIDAHENAGLAIGASVRKTPGAADRTRVPAGYGPGTIENADTYLLNRAPPISMGSGLARQVAINEFRFPESITIDEDTWFWTALLATTDVAVTTEPVLVYHLDGQRTASRYLRRPRQSWLEISSEFRRLRVLGVSDAALKWRRAWVAQRFARQLIKHGCFDEAAALLRPVYAHPQLGREWRTTRYRLLASTGRRFGQQSKTAPSIRKKPEHRTLILCHDPAWPPVSGADLRNVQNARSAASLGPAHLVSLRAHDPIGPPSPDFTVTSLSRPDDGHSASLNWPRLRIEPRIPTIALERLLQEIRDFNPDTVIVEGIGLQAFIRPLRPHVQQLILDMHNIESNLAQQIRTLNRRPAIVDLDVILMQRREIRALKSVDRAWVCSRDDRNRLAFVRKPVDVVPNGIPRFEDIPDLIDNPSPNVEPPALFFVGHLGYGPNIDAVRRLAIQILPLIREHFPDIRLLLAGRYPKPAVRELDGLAGVEVHENPERLGDLYSRASLSLVPLRAGGGSRIKILEAAAWGIPVVATPLAAEGLELEPDRQVLLADSDAELARLAIDLLTDRPRWLEQRRQANLIARLSYSPDAITSAVRSGLGPDG